MTTVDGKIFKLVLVDIDFFDEIKAYLRKLKYFQYGLAILTKTQRDFDIMYIYVKYTKKKVLDVDRLHYCRIRKATSLNVRDLNLMKDNGEVVWEEGILEYEIPSYKQKKIDEYLVIEKQIDVLIK